MAAAKGRSAAPRPRSARRQAASGAAARTLGPAMAFGKNENHAMTRSRNAKARTAVRAFRRCLRTPGQATLRKTLVTPSLSGSEASVATF